MIKFLFLFGVFCCGTCYCQQRSVLPSIGGRSFKAFFSDEMMQELKNNPDTSGLRGSCYVKFQTDSMHNLTNVSFINGTPAAFGRAVLQVLKKTNGMWDCKGEGVWLVLPVIYTLEYKDKTREAGVFRKYYDDFFYADMTRTSPTEYLFLPAIWFMKPYNDDCDWHMKLKTPGD